jgi:hypothetical protein
VSAEFAASSGDSQSKQSLPHQPAFGAGFSAWRRVCRLREKFGPCYAVGGDIMVEITLEFEDWRGDQQLASDSREHRRCVLSPVHQRTAIFNSRYIIDDFILLISNFKFPIANCQLPIANSNLAIRLDYSRFVDSKFLVITAKGKGKINVIALLFVRLLSFQSSVSPSSVSYSSSRDADSTFFQAWSALGNCMQANSGELL